MKGRQDILQQMCRDCTLAQWEIVAIESFEYSLSIFLSKFLSLSSSSKNRISYERRLEVGTGTV